MTINEASWPLPTINADRCMACGLCQQLCPTQAVEVVGKLAVIIRPEDCTFCDVCESYCPMAAIERPFTISFAFGK
jgi:MinD superfamily P-loop ATPase